MVEPFIESLPLGVALFDREMRYVAHNSAYVELFEEDLRHGTAWQLLGSTIYDAHHGTFFRQITISVVLAGVTSEDEGVRYRRANGDVRCYDLLYRPVWSDSGRVSGVLSTVIDVTQSRGGIVELDRLLALASEQMRTTTTIMKGLAQVAARTAEKHEDPRLSAMLSKLDNHCDHLSTLLNELPAVFRMRDDEFEPHMAHLNLGAVLRNVKHENQVSNPSR